MVVKVEVVDVWFWEGWEQKSVLAKSWYHLRSGMQETMAEVQVGIAVLAALAVMAAAMEVEKTLEAAKTLSSTT